MWEMTLRSGGALATDRRGKGEMSGETLIYSTTSQKTIIRTARKIGGVIRREGVS